MDETYTFVLPAGGCTCFVRLTVTADTVDFYLSEKRHCEATKTFLQKAVDYLNYRKPLINREVKTERSEITLGPVFTWCFNANKKPDEKTSAFGS